jgi:hypothetical protein
VQLPSQGVTVGPERAEGTELILDPDLAFDDIFMDVPFDPGVSHSLAIEFELNNTINEADGRLPFQWDFEQKIPPQPPFIPETVVGGQRFTIDVSKYRLVATESEWAYFDAGEDLGRVWIRPEFDDSRWRRGRGPLGFGGQQRTTVNGGPSDKRHTIYFRKIFDAGNPSIYRNYRLNLSLDDGAIVYLNGEEIYRRNLRGGPGFSTLADEDVDGLKECVYWDIPLGDNLPIREGANVIAVQVHQSTTDSDDVRFDLGFCANGGDGNIRPDLKMLAPVPGDSFAPGKPVTVLIEALDQDGVITRVDLFVDGERFTSLSRSPYETTVDQLELGSHVFTAVAYDNEEGTKTFSSRINIANGLAPQVVITSPTPNAHFMSGQPFQVRAEIPASPIATVQQVDLYLDLKQANKNSL